MKIIPRDKLIVRASFLLPFRGGEIWALELDALSLHTELAIEKFWQDVQYVWRPSTTSRVAIHLKDTQFDERFIAIYLPAAGGAIKRLLWHNVRPRLYISPDKQKPPLIAEAFL